MKQFWKKGIAILLVLVSVLSLCACGADNTPSDSETPTIGNEESTDKAPENLNVPFYSNGLKNIDVSLLSAQPYEDDDVYVEITGIKYNRNEDQSLPSWSLIFYCKIENRTTYTMDVNKGRAYINGYYCDLSVPKNSEVQPGETKDLCVYVNYAQFQRNNISEIGNGICMLDILFEGYGWTRVTMPFVAKENYAQQQQYTGGNVVYKKDGLKVVEQGFGEWSSFYDEAIRLYVENTSDQIYYIRITGPKGQETPTWCLSDSSSCVYVYPGTTGIIYVDVSYELAYTSRTDFPLYFNVFVEESDDGFYYIREVDAFDTPSISAESPVVTEPETDPS